MFIFHRVPAIYKKQTLIQFKKTPEPDGEISWRISHRIRNIF